MKNNLWPEVWKTWSENPTEISHSMVKNIKKGGYTYPLFIHKYLIQSVHL